MSSKYGIAVLLVYVGLFAGKMATAPLPITDARDPAAAVKAVALVPSDQRPHGKFAD